MLSRNPFVLYRSMLSGWRLQTPFTDNGNYLFDWIRNHAGGSCSRKKNDGALRRKETRFKFLMAAMMEKEARASVYGKRKNVLQVVHNRNRETTCRVFPLFVKWRLSNHLSRLYFPSIHES